MRRVCAKDTYTGGGLSTWALLYSCDGDVNVEANPISLAAVPSREGGDYSCSCGKGKGHLSRSVGEQQCLLGQAIIQFINTALWDESKAMR